MNDGEVVAQVGLVLPLHQCAAGEAVALEAVVAVAEVLFVGLSLIGIQATIFSNGPAEAVDRASQRVYFQVEGQFHILINRHLLCVGGRATGCIIVPHGLGQGELGVVVHAQILHIRKPAAMRCLVVNEQTERLRCVAMVEEVNGVVGDEIGGIAFLTDILPVRGRTLELRIPIGALVVEHMITIEALRLAHEVPLANHAGLVACLLEQFREEGARGVDAFEQHLLSVLMAVETRDEAGTAGRRQRVFDKRLVEAHALAGNAVDVGRGSEAADGVTIG